MRYRQQWAAATALLAVVCLQTPVRADPGEIKGQDVMGDKNKSANDGWSQAPVPREQSAAKDAPDPGGESTKQNAERPVPNAGDTNNSNTDPQQTLDQRAPTPSGSNPAAPSN